MGRPQPERTCVGCRRREPKTSLVRIVRAPDGTVAVDPSGRAPGRGAYIHADPGCAAEGLRRGALARALRTGLDGGRTARLLQEALTSAGEER